MRWITSFTFVFIDKRKSKNDWFEFLIFERRFCKSFKEFLNELNTNLILWNTFFFRFSIWRITRWHVMFKIISRRLLICWFQILNKRIWMIEQTFNFEIICMLKTNIFDRRFFEFARFFFIMFSFFQHVMNQNNYHDYHFFA